jgi:hypothetical protein
LVGKLIISHEAWIRARCGYEGISGGKDVKRTETAYAC